VMRVWLRDLLLCREGLAEERTVNVDRLDRIREEASRLSREAVLARIRAVNAAQAALRGNVNPTLTLEHLVLEMRQAAS
jgi:DNA polymerase III gamma/tau subunit